MGLFNSLASVGVAFALIGIVVQDVRLLFPGYGGVLSQEVLLGAALVCLVSALIGQGRRAFATLSPLPFLATFWVLILSDWFARGFTLFQGPGFRGELIVAALLSGYLLARRVRISFTPIFALSVLLVAAEFILASGGVPLLMDDNGVFFFRLELLKRFFPHIPFYYTAWDGGMDARDFFATGALNVFLLYWPIINLFELQSAFNFVVVGILAVVPSLSVWGACRILSLSNRTAAIAGILALASSLQWFKWGLKFGTLGFLTTAGLFPLMLALYVVATQKEREFSKAQTVLFVLVSTLVFLWPLGCLIAAPLGLLLLLFYRRIAAKPYILVSLAALLIINAPWAVVFAKVSKVSSFVSGKDSVHSAVDFIAPSAERTAGSVDTLLKTTHDNFVGANPLVIALALPGLALLGAFERRVFIAIGVWLLGMGIFVSPYKPQLELVRFIVVAILIGVIPAARFIDELLKSDSKLRFVKVSTAAILGMVFLTPFGATNAIRGRTMEKFQFDDSTLNDVAKVIETYGGEGRTLFSGFVLHEFDGGHAAPLVLMTKKPLIASSFAHNQWSYKQVFPEEFLSAKETGIQEYLNIMNVTLVMAHEERWRRFFSEQPKYFEKVGEAGPFWAFRRLGYQATYIQSGAAKLAFSENSIVVIPNEASVVLKFRYFPFLTTDGCEISGYSVRGVQLVKLTNCQPGQQVTISAKGAFRRVVE